MITVPEYGEELMPSGQSLAFQMWHCVLLYVTFRVKHYNASLRRIILDARTMRFDAKVLEQLRLRILDSVVWNNSFVSVFVLGGQFFCL